MSGVLNTKLPRFVNFRYVIFERVLDTMKVAEEFRYERYISEELAVAALSERGDLMKRYVIIKEYAVIN